MQSKLWTVCPKIGWGGKRHKTLLRPHSLPWTRMRSMKPYMIPCASPRKRHGCGVSTPSPVMLIRLAGVLGFRASSRAAAARSIPRCNLPRASTSQYVHPSSPQGALGIQPILRSAYFAERAIRPSCSWGESYQETYYFYITNENLNNTILFNDAGNQPNNMACAALPQVGF